jgi:hypothetical protein
MTPAPCPCRSWECCSIRPRGSGKQPDRNSRGRRGRFRGRVEGQVDTGRVEAGVCDCDSSLCGDQFRTQTTRARHRVLHLESDPGVSAALNSVAQTSKSAVSQVSKPALEFLHLFDKESAVILFSLSEASSKTLSKRSHCLDENGF